MAEHDRLDDELQRLAQLGEQGAGPGWDAGEVRRRGTARRQRRHALGVVAAVLAVVVLGGGLAFSGVIRLGSDRPDPALSPTPGPSVSATPIRTLTDANLLSTSDIPTQTDEQQIVIADPAAGRSVDQSMVCLTDGLAPLGARQVLSRNFDLVYDSSVTDAPPSDGEPIIYTQALQFDDDAAAARAYATYRNWMNGCRQALTDRGDTPLGDPDEKWSDVSTGVTGSEGSFYEVTYRAKGQDEMEGGYFESVGLTLAGDRMMVTVSLVVGMDYIVSNEQDPPAGDPPAHPQFGLVSAAAERLTS